MQKEPTPLTYPRRVLIRKGLTLLGKGLLTCLADVEIRGKERLPKKGPMILAGNHVAVLEAVMMAVYTPGIVEFFGTGDIPFDPNYAAIVNAYGLIPVNRGNLDRQALKMGLAVLEQEGILGIFPEGGHWDPANMGVQIGVAWLSQRAQAPILPIGFGGIKGALKKALRLENPQLLMTVGRLIPPVTLAGDHLSTRASLENAAHSIMSAINALVPQEDLATFRRRVDEVFMLEIEVHSADKFVPIPADLRIGDGAGYARLLFNPTMLDTLVRNLHLPIKPLKEIYRQSDLEPVLKAWNAILKYLEINPGFFTYRFGVENGLAVKETIHKLMTLGVWVQDSGFRLSLVPVRRFRNANTGAQVIERGGCFPRSM